MEINNRNFLISGGASGLGLATARVLLDNGARVSIIDIQEIQDPELKALIGTRTLWFKTDVTREEEVEKAIQQTLEVFGEIHGLINCAGIGPAARVVGRDGPHALNLFQKVIDINLVGAFNLIRLATYQMQNNTPGTDGERGVIILTASVAAFDGQIGQAAYSASKGGLVAMTLPLAREFARMGVRVMTIAPGIFETPLLSGLSDEIRESLGKQVPFPSRLGQANEFAALAKHILENRMLNGEVIRLDGGIRMAPK